MFFNNGLIKKIVYKFCWGIFRNYIRGWNQNEKEKYVVFQTQRDWIFSQNHS